MSIAKVKAAVANAPLTLTEAGLAGLDEEIPFEVLTKLEPIINQDIITATFPKLLGQLLTADEVAKYGAMLTTAAQPTYVGCMSGDWYDACNQLGPEHTAENTAGAVAKAFVKSGIRVTIPGQPTQPKLGLRNSIARDSMPKTIQVARPNAKRPMRFHMENHVKPLMAAIAAFEAATVQAADTKVA
jgi:hypothetical protein